MRLNLKGIAVPFLGVSTSRRIEVQLIIRNVSDTYRIELHRASSAHLPMSWPALALIMLPMYERLWELTTSFVGWSCFTSRRSSTSFDDPLTCRRIYNVRSSEPAPGRLVVCAPFVACELHNRTSCLLCLSQVPSHPALQDDPASVVTFCQASACNQAGASSVRAPISPVLSLPAQQRYTGHCQSRLTTECDGCSGMARSKRSQEDPAG